MKKHIYLLEIFLAFFLYNCINYAFFPEAMGYLTAPLHPYWIVVLFIPARYGLIPGFTAGLVSTLHLLYFTFEGMPTRLQLEQYAESQGLALPLAFLFISLFLGVIRQKYKNSEEEKNTSLEENKVFFNEMKTKLSIEEKARNLLESRIIGETTTIKTLYEVSKKFEDMDAASIYNGCLEILSIYLKVEKSSLYIKENEFLLLKASYGWSQGDTVEGKILIHESIMNIAIKENKLITVKDILKRPDTQRYESQYGQVLAMLPMRDSNNNAIGVINIEKIDFLQFNKANLELMELIVDWTSQALNNKQNLEKLQSKLIFDETEGVYSYNYFRHSIEREWLKVKKYNIALGVSFIKLDKFGFLEENAKRLLALSALAYLKKSLSKTDLIFRYKYEGTYAVISPLKNIDETNEDLKRFKISLMDSIQTKNTKIELPNILVSSSSLTQSDENIVSIINKNLEECRIPTI